MVDFEGLKSDRNQAKNDGRFDVMNPLTGRYVMADQIFLSWVHKEKKLGEIWPPAAAALNWDREWKVRQ